MVFFMKLYRIFKKKIEIKCGASIKAFIAEEKKIADDRLFNNTTQKKIRIRNDLHENMKDFMTKIGLSY